MIDFALFLIAIWFTWKVLRFAIEFIGELYQMHKEDKAEREREELKRDYMRRKF